VEVDVISWSGVNGAGGETEAGLADLDVVNLSESENGEDPQEDGADELHRFRFDGQLVLIQIIRIGLPRGLKAKKSPTRSDLALLLYAFSGAGKLVEEVDAKLSTPSISLLKL
jgi:hypothetical protein